MAFAQAYTTAPSTLTAHGDQVIVRGNGSLFGGEPRDPAADAGDQLQLQRRLSNWSPSRSSRKRIAAYP